MVNVMWPPTDKVKSIPISKRFPEGALDEMKFWTYDGVTTTVIIRLNKRQYRLVDPKDLLKFREKDLKTLSRFQITAEPLYEPAAKEYTGMVGVIIREGLWADPPAYKEVGIQHVSPNSGRKTYTPLVSASIKLNEGMIFENLQAAESFYRRYALAGGFSIRKGTQWVDKNVVRLKVKYFGEAHNHPFVDKDDIHFLKSARELTFTHKKMLDYLANINIGPVNAFNIMRTMYGGFDKVSATKSDCKNYQRSINLFIGDYDVEMAVQRLLAKKEFCPNFSCDYSTAADGALMGLFWADERAKMNFYVFGDVSFDATYRHNKYNLVFVPFTGIDNHNRNVTLGAALLGSETVESYTWLLNCFKKAFGYAPAFVVTDQDPAMKRAIEDFFPNSRHRLYMWHIMDKVSRKVGSGLCNTTDFKTRLCDIVWTDSITPELFETEWASIMDDFQLSDHTWLKDIFNIRESWIPAYYREETMSGLMRTSSISESENHFFSQFCNPHCTLVEFLAHIETALDHQSHEHRKNDHDCRCYVPVDDFLKFNIRDFLHLPASFHEVMIRNEESLFIVAVKGSSNSVYCAVTFLRWTKDAVSNSPMWSIGFDEPNIDKSTDVYRVVRDINIAHDHNINKLVDDMQKLHHYRDYINAYKSTVDEVTFDGPRPSRRDRFAELTGVTQPDQIHIRASIGVRTKGCGLPIHFRSLHEQAISQKQLDKPLRTCRICREPGHDTRNHHLFSINNKPPQDPSQDGASSSHEENMEE
ncbi:protein FAR1-RELATED SEQUENCE 5-like [Bidens hawaiensis]|uniref:protein FAR1-RELATED SEQUENCE 5-like n=1 Tax=Bidens hawaiensis TaxID=980011 RepID=UPI00404B1F5F